MNGIAKKLPDREAPHGLLCFEREAWAEGRRVVAGVDEAGRGPLAGPVMACAVVFDAAFLQSEEHGRLEGLTDSKQLSRAERDHFYDLFQDAAVLRFGLGVVEAEAIDAVNILQATHQAMRQALAQLAPPPDHVLVDGRPVPRLPCASTAIIKGDARSLSIAAASVIAKVTRDRVMLDWDRTYPQYGFARHKGYGTDAHRQALRRCGPCPCHRRSFRPVRQWEHQLPNG